MALEAARAQHHADSIQNLDKQCYCYQNVHLTMYKSKTKNIKQLNYFLI